MKKNNKKGFTLVELVIVVAVMAILVAVAIPTVSYVTSKASDTVTKSNCQTIESLVKLAEAEAKVDDKTAKLSTSIVAKAMIDGKLGITSGDYYYDETTGKVNTEAAPEGDTAAYFKITFGTKGVTVVSKADTTGTTLGLDGKAATAIN